MREEGEGEGREVRRRGEKRREEDGKKRERGGRGEKRRERRVDF
jgi:hypothetical protein